MSSSDTDLQNRHPNVLLIDDDVELGTMLVDLLEIEGLALTVCHGGEDGLQTLRSQNFDILILDIMMPDINGLEVLKRLRNFTNIPVIMLTARGDDVDRIIGLELGADDYLTKPFNPRELTARLRAILRRATVNPGELEHFTAGGIELDPGTRGAICNGQPLELTGTEYEILRCLLANPGSVVKKDSLCEHALGRKLLPYDRSIDTHISNIRRKIAVAGGSADLIRNQRGIGYLVLPDA